MHHAPAQILARLLVQLELGVAYNVDADWAVVVSSLPDKPNKAIIVSDTAGKKDARIHRTGQLVKHPGLQIRVRSTDYNDAHSKMIDVETALSAVQRLEVDVLDTLTGEATDAGSRVYLIQTVIQTSPVFSMPRDEKSRDTFVANYLINYRQL